MLMSLVWETARFESEQQYCLEGILSRLQGIEECTVAAKEDMPGRGLIVVYQGEVASIGLYEPCSLGERDCLMVASTYDPSLASAINAEFRELLIQELEKVDDRFFEVHDTSEEEIDDLDGTVLFPVL